MYHPATNRNLMKLKELCSYFDSSVPVAFQESYDNSGLQIGLPENEISSALLTLDITNEVVDEAIDKGCDLIISHHPLIFSGLKKITGRTLTEKLVYKIIKHNISVYSAHTNLDAIENGVSRKMAEKLKMKNIRVLSPLKNKLMKLVTYIPESHFQEVTASVFEVGAGVIGNYDYCGFNTPGTGSFRGNEGSKPFLGKKGIISYEKEVRFETILFSHLKEKVINALLAVHPYEEVAYDLYNLDNDNINAGLGCIGELNEALGENDFLKLLSEVFNAKGIRYSEPTGRKVKKVALCGGSGASLISKAISSGADAFVTADIRYHNFFDADSKLLLVDTGHFESEFYSIEILYDLVIKKFPKFAVRFSETNTNPINYL